MPSKARKTATAELQSELATLSKQQIDLKDEIQKERKKGYPDETTLKNQIDTQEHQLLQAQNKLKKAKAHVKKRKQEIKQWKSNFEKLDKIDKSQELIQLQKEIEWRAIDIANKEKEIAGIYESITSLNGELESQRIKQQIIEQGYHKKSIQEDPRLLALSDEIQQLQTEIDNATS